MPHPFETFVEPQPVRFSQPSRKQIKYTSKVLRYSLEYKNEFPTCVYLYRKYMQTQMMLMLALVWIFNI